MSVSRPGTPNLVSDDDKFAAIARRDVAADGAFVFSVATTGVYCRPTCAARPALRKNVAYHATPDDAERAGFRPCKRCRPRDVSAHDRTAALVAAARKRIEESDVAPNLEELATAAGTSRFHFQRLFKSACGMTPKQYANAVRGTRVRRDLVDGANVTRAMYDTGFTSSSRFYDTARSFGMTPTDLRAGGAGIAIHAATAMTALGTMLVAATDRGVCAIFFGDDEATLRADLGRRFPNAHFVDAPMGFTTWTQAIAAYVERPQGSLDMPLDVVGTAFQQRVWRELQSIDPGTTATYSEIAGRLGAPRATRAVANACANNPTAIAIPCHRVVRRDGELGGYRWGLARKRELLERERPDHERDCDGTGNGNGNGNGS